MERNELKEKVLESHIKFEEKLKENGIYKSEYAIIRDLVEGLYGINTKGGEKALEYFDKVHDIDEFITYLDNIALEYYCRGLLGMIREINTSDFTGNYDRSVVKYLGNDHGKHQRKKCIEQTGRRLSLNGLIDYDELEPKKPVSIKSVALDDGQFVLEGFEKNGRKSK